MTGWCYGDVILMMFLSVCYCLLVQGLWPHAPCHNFIILLRRAKRQVHGRVVNNGLFVIVIDITYHGIYYSSVKIILIHGIDDIE